MLLGNNGIRQIMGATSPQKQFLQNALNPGGGMVTSQVQPPAPNMGKGGAVKLPGSLGQQPMDPSVVAPTPNALPTDFRSKWYSLADKIAPAQNARDLADASKAGNAGLQGGLGTLGFRGNNNSGSMEQLAKQGAVGQVQAGNAAGQSMYNNLAGMYSQGLSGIDIPVLQGKDMVNAQNAGKKKGALGLGFLGL